MPGDDEVDKITPQEAIANLRKMAPHHLYWYAEAIDVLESALNAALDDAAMARTILEAKDRESLPDAAERAMKELATASSAIVQAIPALEFYTCDAEHCEHPCVPGHGQALRALKLAVGR